jgi:hypothetical protein
MYHYKYYDNIWHITEQATLTWTEKTTHWKGYDNGWHITEKATLMWIIKVTHWKGYDNGWHITENATLMWIEKITHWKGYDNRWPITEKATLTRTEKTTLTYHWKGYDDGSHIAEKATWNSDMRQHVYIKICPPEMYLHTSLTRYCFASLPHYPFQHVWILAPRMESASILPLSTPSKDGHLFPANHVWKEVLGVSTAWSKWLHRLLYLDFLMWFF